MGADAVGRGRAGAEACGGTLSSTRTRRVRVACQPRGPIGRGACAPTRDADGACVGSELRQYVGSTSGLLPCRRMRMAPRASGLGSPIRRVYVGGLLSGRLTDGVLLWCARLYLGRAYVWSGVGPVCASVYVECARRARAEEQGECSVLRAANLAAMRVAPCVGVPVLFLYLPLRAVYCVTW